MQYRTLGRTGLNVSIASLGTGGQSRLGMATHADPKESIRLVHRPLDLGINFFDTAPTYLGTEALLGEALSGVPRDSYFVATKVMPVEAEHVHALRAPAPRFPNLSTTQRESPVRLNPLAAREGA